jgi:hypothetical protein
MNTQPTFIVSKTAYEVFLQAESDYESSKVASKVIPVIAFGRDEVEGSVGKMTDAQWADYLAP